MAQKKEQLRYKTEDDLEVEVDPELAEAKAAINGISITDDDAHIVRSENGSLRLSAEEVGRSIQSSQDLLTRSDHTTDFNPREMFAKHLSHPVFPRRNFSDVEDAIGSSDEEVEEDAADELPADWNGK